VFLLKAEPQELQSWEIAILNAVSEISRVDSEVVHKPLPFLVRLIIFCVSFGFLKQHSGILGKFWKQWFWSFSVCSKKHHRQ
jgi:hypothetical protein